MGRPGASRQLLSGLLDRPALGLAQLERAIAALRYLEENLAPSACTVSRIAAALGLHKSTCSNILRSLEAAAFLEYDSDAKAYRLGPELIGLSACAGSRRDSRQIELRHVEALARVALAWRDRETAAAYFKRWEARPTTPSTITDPAALTAELDRVRRRGYAVSIGEYYPANTAISAPIFSPRDDRCRGLCLVAFSAELGRDRIARVGEAVRATARAITRALGGAAPRS